MARIDKRSKLAELKALRSAGKKAFDTYKIEDADDLYEEVDEDGYKKIVRDRLDQDDFVVDDNGEGYADDGREEWDRAPQYDSESDDGLMARGRPSKASKKQKEEEKAKRDANDRDITDFFTKGAAKAQPKPKVVKTKEDDDFLDNLLGEVDSNIPAPVSRSAKRNRSPAQRKVRVQSPAREPAVKKKKVLDTRLPSPPTTTTALDDDDDFLPMMDDPIIPSDAPMSDPAPSSPTVKAVERKTQIKEEPKSDDDDEDMLEVGQAGAVAATSVNIAGSRPPKRELRPEPKPQPPTSNTTPSNTQDTVDSSLWNELTEKLNVVSSPASTMGSIGKMDYRDAIESDGSLNFFWTDYTEANGSLCLFGKVLNKKTGSYVSCFVKVDNIWRKLFFLPRERRFSDEKQTEEPLEIEEVFKEVDELMIKMNVGVHKAKLCERRYAFELKDIPKSAEYLKLLYPYNKPPLDPTLPGRAYSHVFGTNTSLFEQFVLWKNVMGPCWLKIEDADFDRLQNASHCKLEVLVEHPNMISCRSDSDNLDEPPLTIMSVSMRTTFNQKANKQEILALSARIYENVSLNDATPADKLPCRTFTVIRPNGSSFPLGFEGLVRNRNKGRLIKTVKQEGELLSFFLAQLNVVDPDVILGHQLEGVDYSILLSRLQEKKTPQWSRLGRLRRAQWPSSIGKLGGNVFAERQVIAGRLLCDLANDAGKSVMFKCQSWSLTEMCSIYLPGNPRRRDVDNDAALKTWATTKDGLVDYVNHMEADTHYIAALALQIQLLPLTKVLTNLAGNSWARTLTGTRAERNEYILLHEFHRNKYICPDKQTFRGRQKQDDEAQEAEGGDGKKKDKYKGGLVFEPQKGLYDKFVLVMDFNSLYPSIIQEFNICFTTVDRSALDQGEDVVPEVPKDQALGILPKLISTLVNRRRHVKAMMKDKGATAEQLVTWDIKQLALKLTANSMYGCLGYTKSRFYARPLAVLTTHKGREILTSTKNLAEEHMLQVIYGDTDSVMINANVDNVADAIKVGNEFKKLVNSRYQLLEIDIDNIFRRILLQAKKKYAAVSLVEKEGKWVEKMEVKGLDMKRREYCALSKEVSQRILNDILSGDEAEVAVARIHEYLREVSASMREGTVPVGKYIIFTQLGKAPQDYPNGDSMPQVQVALRDVARGKTVRKGDVVSYVITGEPSSSEPAPKRAYAPGDVTKKDSGLAVDVEWYLGKQIFPPVERLCANITGTSTAQLAENLGLDIRRYTTHTSSTSPTDVEIHPLESQIPDKVRFADCTRLSLRCRACGESSAFEGLVGSPDLVSAKGVVCGKCKAVIPVLSVVAQVERAVREETTRYYEGWVVCNEATCGVRTRQVGVKGAETCLGPRGLCRDCKGKLRFEYGEKAIYNQLLYFTSLWDVERAKERARSIEGGVSAEVRETVLAMAEHNRVRFGTVKGVMDKYLEKCGRQWVAMDNIFAKLKFHEGE